MRPLLLLLLITAIAVAQPAPAISRVTLDGKLLDPPDRLARFLGLTVGAPVDDALRDRVAREVDALGYLATGDLDVGADGAVHLALEPRRVVRHVDVHGNWPVFNDDIRRRLNLRPGSYLPVEAETGALLAAESARVRDFLHRDGWFWADVDVIVKPAGRPEWVDLDVIVFLGPSTRLGDVRPSGNFALSRDDLFKEFSASVFKPWWFGRFRLDQMRDDARSAEALYRERGYPAARVVPEFDLTRDLDRRSRRAVLPLRVTEKGRVDLHFEGNRSIPDKRLRERITIFSAGSYDEVELTESAKEIHRYYQTKGFLEAQVTFRRTREGATQEITFVVAEGPELKVRGIDFAPEFGAPPLTVDEKLLRAQLTTKVFPRIGVLGLGEGGFVTAEQLKLDERNLEAWYRGQGFPEARVRGEIARDVGAFGNPGVLGADVAASGGGDGDLYLRFYVDEGRREIVERVDVRFTGPHTRAPIDLTRDLKLQPGAPYTIAALDADRKKLIGLYASSGHPYASIDPTGSTWSADHRRVTLALLVDEGPEVRFGEVLIRGNFKTAQSVIRSDLPFRPGDLFSTEKLEVARRNLQTHTIFNGVAVKPQGLTVLANPVPVLIELQERYDDWGTPFVSIGYSTDIGLSEAAGYFLGDVFGGGGSVELRGDVAEDFARLPATASDFFSYNSQFWRLLSASLRYVHPHIFVPSLRLELQGALRKENTIRLGEVISEGFSISLSWVASPTFRLFGRYDFTSSQQQNIDLQRLPGTHDERSSVNDSTVTGRLTLGAVWDDRVSFGGAKNPLLPVEGWLLGAAFSVAAKPLGFELAGTHDFLVFSGQAQRYQPLGHDVTLIVNLRGDWGVPIGEPSLPAVERFFGGGDTATRGFDTDKLKTEIVRGDVSPGSGAIGYRIIPQGGNIRFLGTVELQFPITDVLGFPLVGALFVDVGSLFNAPSSFGGEDVKASVGLTLLRILTPVGPLSLEYAYPLTQTLAEEQWKKESWFLHWPGRIHFNWGIPIIR